MLGTKSSAKTGNIVSKRLRRKPPSLKSKNALFQSDPNWIDRYVEISIHLGFGDFEKSLFDDVHLDILRDLCNEDLPSDYVFHLLTLLELIVPLFDSVDKIEQTIGSLLNIVTSQQTQSTKRPLLIINKCVYSATSLMLFTHEWRHKSQSINDLFRTYIAFLLKQSRNGKSILRPACSESLREVANMFPNLIETLSSCNPAMISPSSNPSELIYSMALFDTQHNVMGIRELAHNICFTPELEFYHLCTQIYNKINSNEYSDSLSLIMLKPFIRRFISSNLIHFVHFALKLLIKSGFEIFSSTEEEYFMKQLVTLSTLPSLPIGYRLLCLSFIKIAFVAIYKPPLNSPPLGLIDSLCPYLFDGPDTQEKKIAILNEFSFVITDNEFFNLFSRLHRLSDAQYNNYKRSTNSMFRVMNISLSKRPQLTERILNFLLESIFLPPYSHYVDRLYLFLSQHWQFAQQFIDKFIANLMILAKENESGETGFSVLGVAVQHIPTIRSYNQYFAFLHFINWFLSVAHHHIKLTEFQIEFIINFIRLNCMQWSQSSTIALTCCTSILYYQQVSPKVKEALLTILEWLKNERKIDLETSSLAQIYLLALRTLKEEYIRQVFTSDEEEFIIQKIPESFDDYLGSIVRNQHQHSCSLLIKRAADEDGTVRHCYDIPRWIAIPFDISIADDSEIDRLFCVEVAFTSSQVDGLKQTFQLPFIEKNSNKLRIHLTIDFLVNIPFWLNTSVTFVDYKGTIHNYHQANFEFIPLKDVFIPVEIDPRLTGQTLEEISKVLLKHSDSLQTVICARKHSNINSFLADFKWMKRFLLVDLQAASDDDQRFGCNFAIGLTPDRLIIGKIKIINGFVNLYLTTNNYEIIPALSLHTFEN